MTMPNIPGFTAEELAVLTPDELSALQAADGGDEDALTELAGGDDTGANAGDDNPGDGEPGAGGTEDEQPAGELEQGAKRATETPAKEEGGAKSDDLDDDDEPFSFAAPADATEKRQTLTAERDKAFSDLMDGTIDTEAYNEINNRVTAELEAIASAVSKAELASAMREHEAKKLWKKTVNEFFESAKKEGADYRANEALNKELDGLVKVFAAEAAAKGMSDVGLKASKYALEQAQIVMRARHGFKPAENAGAAGQKGQSEADKAIAAANAVRHNLKTLTNMPAADKVITDDSPLSKIASLEGEELELYMATLSPAELRRLESASDK